MSENSEKQVCMLFESARRSLHLHDVTSALKNLLEALEKEPDNAEVISLMGNCYFNLGEFEYAAGCWQRVIDLEPNNKNAKARLNHFKSPSFQIWLRRYYEALRKVEGKDFEGAEKRLRELLEENDGFVKVYQLLGVCYLAMGQPQQAKVIWHKGLELDKSNEILLNYLASSPISKTRPSPGNITAKPASGQIKRGRLVGILAGVLCLALVIQSGFFIKDSRESKETLKNMQERIDFLSQQVEQQVAAVPVLAEVSVPVPEEIDKVEQRDKEWQEEEEQYYYQGYNAYLVGDWEKAISSLGKVVAMESGSYLNREALYYLARTNFLNGEYGYAEYYYKKYLNDFPDTNYYDDSMYYLGCIYYYTERKAEAKETFNKFRQLFPDSGYTSTKIFQEVIRAAG
ncbi:MAG: tetratricopeptide repeat protein [Syntrophomonadaceae bacterium]|jgi:tetratricopeptide (TPR) repeat protein